jgi:hypothetical protein
MHGALLSLALGIPFIPIDQIRGGAKMTAVLRAVEWPLVLSVDPPWADGILRSTTDWIVNGAVVSSLTHSRNHLDQRGPP